MPGGGGSGVQEVLTSSPSSFALSAGFSLSLVRGLVTTRIPPTCRVTGRQGDRVVG